jgi:hypothetical protein
LQALALEHAADEGDLALMQRLASEGYDLKLPLQSGSALDHALLSGKFELARWLLGQGVGVKRGLIYAAGHCPADLTRELLARGCRINASVVARAAAAGLMDSAQLIAEAAASHGPAVLNELIHRLDRFADRDRTDADDIEAGKTLSNLNPDELREGADRFKEITDFCVSLFDKKVVSIEPTANLWVN